MSFHEIFQQFIEGMKATTWPEYVAVFAGIASVWFSRKENILVYPVGLVNTSIFIYLYLKHGLYADASVNFYYTVMSILGWSMWAKKNMGESTLKITSSNAKEWGQAVA